MLKSLCLGLAVLLGIAEEANGIFMLVSPASWYFAVPGVTSTGHFNQHFLRDIGLIFVLIGGAFVADDPRLSKETKVFLKELNSAGVALETLTPLEARQVLVDAQASAPVDLSGIDEFEKTIIADGYAIADHIRHLITTQVIKEAPLLATGRK